MGMLPVRVARALIATLIVTSSAIHAAGPSTADNGDGRHQSGLVVLGPEIAELSLSAHLAVAWHEAAELSERHSDDLGYPWVDRRTGSLVLDVVTPKGRLAVDGWARHRAESDIPQTLRTVRFSRTELERIKDEAIDLRRAGIPNADMIFMTEPDPEHNRIVVTVTKVDNALFAELARRYGSDAIAVRVNPDGSGLPGSRESDTSPFYGSSLINTSSQNGGSCTSGWAWQSGSTQMMVTAGHCVYRGLGVFTPAQYMGEVTANSEESWNLGTGTVLMTGQATFRGDIGLIRIAPGKSSAPYIFRGIGPNTSTTSVVGGMPPGRAAVGNQLCHGGYNGDVCGWVVRSAGINYAYADGTTVRNAVRAEKRGWCFKPGDSGSPVYYVGGDGKIIAQGIGSGDVRFGGSDYYAGAFDAACRLIFTDIYDAFYGFPGSLKIG